MTPKQCLAANAKVRKTIKKVRPGEPAHAAPKGWPGHGPMYLVTDGRETVLTPIEGRDFKGRFWITPRFACPYCGEYSLSLDVTDPNDTDATHAECMSCCCAMKAKRTYQQWEPGEEVFIWW